MSNIWSPCVITVWKFHATGMLFAEFPTMYLEYWDPILKIEFSRECHPKPKPAILTVKWPSLQSRPCGRPTYAAALPWREHRWGYPLRKASGDENSKIVVVSYLQWRNGTLLCQHVVDVYCGSRCCNICWKKTKYGNNCTTSPHVGNCVVMSRKHGARKENTQKRI